MLPIYSALIHSFCYDTKTANRIKPLLAENVCPALPPDKKINSSYITFFYLFLILHNYNSSCLRNTGISFLSIKSILAI